MKKVKYLLGLLVVGVGLLFNQSFALNYITVDGVIEGSLTSNTSRSSNYRYIFAYGQQTTNGTATPYTRQFGFSLYYDGATKVNYSPYQFVNEPCPPSYSNFYVRTGRTTLNWYTGSCVAVGRYNNYWSFENMPQLSWSAGQSFDGSIRVLIGQGDLFGNAFVVAGVPDSTSSNVSPVFSLGWNNLYNDNYITVNENYSDYYRFFYKDTGGIASLDSHPTSSNLADGNFNSWEYFYPRGTRTNYGYIVDDGSLYTKYKHFGLFDMGYSYVYGKVSQSATSLSWSELGFRTVGDEVETALKLFGDMSYNELQSYSTNGILLVRANQYLSMGNDDGVYLLSKDPNNYSRVLYEHWSCNSDNIKLIFSGGDSYFHCVKLDGGYLTYNGSTEVLPFTDSTSLKSINTLDSDHPLLYDLANGGKGLTNVAGQTAHSTNSCLQINSNRCYGFLSSNLVNIKESYLQTLPLSVQESQDITKQNCQNESYAIAHPDLCWEYTNVVFTGGGSYKYSYLCDENGNCAYQLIPYTFSGSTYINSSGDIYYLSSGTNAILGNGSEYFSGGIVSSGYYSLSNTGLFFRCPYPTVQYISIPGLNLGQFDVFLPVNCFITAFKEGRTFELFGQYSIFTSFDNPLISGNTNNHKALFMFLDFIISLALFSFVAFIYRLFK